MNKPKQFLIFKIIGFIGIIIAFIGIVLLINGFGNFENNNFIIGGFMMTFGLFIGLVCLINGFKPELSKLSIKSTKYIQEQNKDEIKDIVDTTVDISIDSIERVVETIKDEEQIYCKHCGALIDVDSKFCKKCGKEQ